MSRHPAAWTIVLATVAVLALGLVWTGRSSMHDRRAVSAVSPVSPAAPLIHDTAGEAAVVSVPALDVLQAWDESRARAYAAGDLDSLRALYVAGSQAGAADVGLLRTYRRRGFTITGMRMQLLGVDVLGHTARQWRLRVTDRLDGAVAVGRDQRVQLPRDQASQHIVTLQRVSGVWKVASVVG